MNYHTFGPRWMIVDFMPLGLDGQKTKVQYQVGTLLKLLRPLLRK